ncbi:hypothetical protein C802_03133 [Phocaeicola sartorii]|uniref:Uncharacterized protein n=1 Tax=Phocaeicola sartorii TaxID=671267 RepID=R9I5F1_9BACT|nr:hypothetical protein C802_03133 [Phocaeicola sartorii]
MDLITKDSETTLVLFFFPRQGIGKRGVRGNELSPGIER